MKGLLFHHCIIILLSISLSLSFPLSPLSSEIKNAYIPPCVHCIHHKTENNECMRYGVKDIVTAEVIYEDARDCRRDENKCGYNGLYFEPLSNLKFKMLEVKLNDMKISEYEYSMVAVISIYLLTVVCGYYFFKIFFFPELY